MTPRTLPAGSIAHRATLGGTAVDHRTLRGTWECDVVGARSAFGVAVWTGAGAAVGALVLLDDAPRTWTPVEIGLGREIAEVISTEIARRELEIRLRHAESYEAVLIRSPEAILVHVEGIVEFANPAAVALLGAQSPDDLHGRAIGGFLDAPFLHGIAERLADPVPPQPSGLGLSEERLTRLDGSVRYVEFASLAYVRADTLAVQVFLHDITERRQVQLTLREREAQLRLMLERIPVIHWTTDAELNIESIHWGGGVLRETTVESFFGKNRNSVPVTTHRRALAGEAATDILDWRGGTFEVRVEPLRDRGGAIVGTVGVMLDTTLRRRIEEQGRADRELETLGRVAGGVAHGINNALATITGVASLMESQSANGDAKNLRAILEAGARAHALTSNLLGFAGEGRYRLVRIDLNAMAAEMADWLRGEGHRVDCELASDLHLVEGDADQVHEAIRNVCQNAVDALGEHGRISISTAGVVIDAPGGLLEPGGYATLTVKDTGSGMAHDVRTRAIEPFFTTKEVGAGAGLGLSMAFGVARNHGGDLHIESTLGEGTAVTLSFPQLAAHVGDNVPVTPSFDVRPLDATRRALVVDDDEWVRYSSRGMLERLGYEVVEASDGFTALQQFQQSERRFDFVLLDLRMPGMDGEEVLTRLVASDPDVRVIVCTGYDREQVSQRIFTFRHVGYLGKPFTVEDLEREIASIFVEAA